MKRILTSETTKNIGKKVRVSGWVNILRSHGQIAFLDLRDRSGILQVVLSSDLAKDIKEEDVVEIEGKIKARPDRMKNPELETGGVEMEAEKINILAKSEPLPFDLKDLKTSLPVALDYRPLTLRNKKVKAVFKIQEEIIASFRRTVHDMDFTEFQSPVIVPSATEGGAELFKVRYYNHDAYLAQSPQFYKQIMVGVFERAFTVTKVFRAEPSETTRHLSEYTSLDVEMGFIDSWEDLMDACQKVIKTIFADVEKNCKEELKLLKVSVPQIKKNIPRLKMREAQEIIFKRTKRDNRKEMDLEPEDEKEIGLWAKEKEGSDLVFITHYPTKKRPFYTFPDPEDKNYTLSFDVLCRGLEIVTGGQRISDYKQLLKNIKKWGNDPKDFKFYLQCFKYGMPPEGGFAMGAERITKQILGFDNVREASLFPRDMIRIDQKLSAFKNKK